MLWVLNLKEYLSSAPDNCRIATSYRHEDKKLVIAFTDDTKRLQFVAQYSNDVKRLEKFIASMMKSFVDAE
ncbi:unnamed protein product [Oikopleura dioica]|uniref:SRP9 domain-containing protein n=1 Tax=Oikopleura dioica TaxID=34765 RepID=E4XK41_OIKDI|nr:unnamed protein product [Oikopleura dioica]